ncbi:extracellular catalytic domain type 1 short-chain-length polyhydroxyalkanoate depolymerase [Rhodococcoides fascians]|uniref:extracellular catalytic domain type 1 short-chain-length polyhydroxyalkanoate depolymerase n=1 Tax=Rhodococcoides fascians TaxID=1828 RepID=UPI0024BACEDE|nr:PHB depolymerase family esterase [Rhodococcus fascians]MDJ0412666.1 PHB depolymerase family esterase [Rhodococcus fascians]
MKVNSVAKKGFRATLLAVLAVTLGSSTLTTATAAASSGDRDEYGQFVSDAGVVDYQVHLPTGYDPSSPTPIMIALHGCGMTGYGINSMKDTTRFDVVANEEDFIVVYPTQTFDRRPQLCWNAIEPAHQRRGSGEPALIAGVTESVIAKYNGDRSNVHVSGASSGAGLAVAMAVTYPDVFATVTSAAGGEYSYDKAQHDLDRVTPEYTASLAVAEMGDRARYVPLLVVQGDRDDVVRPVMAERLIAQWLSIGGALGDPASKIEPTRVQGPAKYPYTYTRYGDDDGRPSAIESYLVEGMGHVWPGPGAGLFTDAAGIDASRVSWQFARLHTMPE